MVYTTLVRTAEQLSSRCMFELPPLDVWKKQLSERRRQWREMLGLDPLPPRTDLKPTVTGVLDRGRYVVEKLHFQPIPECRIAANLYRPKHPRGRLPAVIYVCGHAQRAKCWYQPHPRWFGEHGYVCMVLDAIQIGECGGFHHGTYSKGWWHWYSQGYSPAGVEVWAAMRAADYLEQRADVQPGKLGITGNSGGGTMSWFTGAADPRFTCVVPSCQTGTMYQHVRDRTIDGHCDCTYWVNTYGWDFPDLACLIAPRPLLVAAATEDTLFRPYAFRDLVHRARQLYIQYGSEDKLALCEAVTQHGYSPRTRLAIFSWFGKHLKGSDRAETEDITDKNENDEDLAVYKTMKPPVRDRLKDVDRGFVPLPDPPRVKGRAAWRRHWAKAMTQLLCQTFRQTSVPVPTPAFSSRRQGQGGTHCYRSYEFESEPGMPIRAHLAIPIRGPRPYPVVVGPLSAAARSPFCGGGAGLEGVSPDVAGFACVEVRGTGSTSIGPGLEWTVRRAMPILGQTLYERRTLDLLTAIQVVRAETNVGHVVVFGKGYDAAIAVYAALLDPTITELVLQDPVATHWNGGPEFLNVLRTGDLPHNLALAFPRPITFIGKIPEAYAWTKACYAVCGMAERVRTVETLGAWRPTVAKTGAAAGRKTAEGPAVVA